jgi:hypothetical protein
LGLSSSLFSNTCALTFPVNSPRTGFKHGRHRMIARLKSKPRDEVQIHFHIDGQESTRASKSAAPLLYSTTHARGSLLGTITADVEKVKVKLVLKGMIHATQVSNWQN